MNNLIDFKDFAPISAKAWKQQIQVDLKGGDYNQLLNWTSPEGITIKPFYTREDLQREAQTHPLEERSGWKIGYAFNLASEKGRNLVRANLENGAESLLVKVPHEAVEKLREVPQDNTEQFWELPKVNAQTLQALKETASSNVTCLMDPIHSLVSTGNWVEDKKTDFEILGDFASNPALNPSLSIHLDQYQNAGANRVQELAYALSHAHEYLLKSQSDARLKPLLTNPVFRVSMGNTYFFEIAKLRALRRLWGLLAREFGFSGRCKIIARPTLRNKALYDYNTNMLRTTTECMSAVLGGADLVCNLPYDSLYHGPNEFASRISRNQLLLLKNESYFSSTTNPADGSYYIETLTDQLGQKALELFKTIEKGGGFLAQLQDHTLQKKIEESAQKEQEAFDRGDLVLVGSNKYLNQEDKMQQILEKSPFRSHRKVQTKIAPILGKRLTEAVERKRLEDEKN